MPTELDPKTAGENLAAEILKPYVDAAIDAKIVGLLARIVNLRTTIGALPDTDKNKNQRAHLLQELAEQEKLLKEAEAKRNKK